MYVIQEEPKTELIEGHEIAMSPASIKHFFIQRNLAVIIGSFLRGKKYQLLMEAEVIFDEENHFIPDLMVVCEPDKIKKNYIEGAPDFIVEVLSPSTRRRDVTIKKETYEKYGVKEYWIISPKDEAIEVYILRNGKYELDNIYHNFDEEDWAALSETEKAEQQLSLKISLYNDLKIQVKEIFE